MKVIIIKAMPETIKITIYIIILIAMKIIIIIICAHVVFSAALCGVSVQMIFLIAFPHEQKGNYLILSCVFLHKLFLFSLFQQTCCSVWSGKQIRKSNKTNNPSLFFPIFPPTTTTTIAHHRKQNLLLLLFCLFFFC